MAFRAEVRAAEPPARTTLSDPAIRFTVPDKPYVVLRRGPIEAVVVDNRAVDDAVLPGHRAGYHGLASLQHTRQSRNIFVPAYAGLNFEHILDGTVQDRAVLFEPRNSPIELRVINDHTAELYQRPTPHYGLESCARYELLDDGAIEMTFECIPRRPTWKFDYLLLFWASYIDRPESLDIHFRGRREGAKTPEWIRGVTTKHGLESTHRGLTDLHEFPHTEPFPLELPFGFSRHRYTEPWYFGICRGMALAQVFRHEDAVRLTQSPSGGGNGCPAWDFQWAIRNCQVNRRYQLVMRAGYIPWPIKPGLSESESREHLSEIVRDSRPRPAATGRPIDYIDTSFENASPLWWEVDSAGVLQVHLTYDHERGSPNRAAGHIHFQIQARPGARFTIEFRNLDNIYNGRPGSVANELKSLAISADGRQWRPVATRSLPDNRVQLDVEMPGPKLFVARVEPYRLSDLARLRDSLRGDSRVEMTEIGRSAEGRPLEVFRLGETSAPRRVFLRARAHPWEAGGNWVVQGLIRRLLKDDEEARLFARRYCVYILPMANPDGVARGRTRFNLAGKDLNRDWNGPADPEFAPENHALEKWLTTMFDAGRPPQLALEVHNDGNGQLHFSTSTAANAAGYGERMARLETLLRRHTWFREGSQKNRPNAGTLADGWLDRFGIDALVHEFNCQWSAGLGRAPMGEDWERYGEGLARVFEEYFSAQP